jgi:hypothetical protein
VFADHVRRQTARDNEARRLLGVVVFIELLDFVPGGRLRDASSGDSTGKIAVQRSDRAMTLQNMRENGAWSLAIQPPNPTGAVAFF